MMKALLVMLWLTTSPLHNNVIGTVNGLPVSQREIQREMQRCRAQVYSRYHSLPQDKWQAMALQALVTIKVQEQLLDQHHQWPYNNYDQLLQDMARMNQQRRLAVRQGKVIYGPVEYDETTFFDYQFGNALIRLKRELKITEEGYAKLVAGKVKHCIVVWNKHQMSS